MSIRQSGHSRSVNAGGGPLGGSDIEVPPDHGIPCILREDSELTEWPLGSAVVMNADGGGVRITEEHRISDPESVLQLAE